MSTDTLQVRDFLAASGPFEMLPQAVLDEVAEAI